MQSQRGFTLIDVLVVVAIIGIVTALAVPGLRSATIATNEAIAIADIKLVQSANLAYATANEKSYASNMTLLVHPPVNISTTPFLDADFLSGQRYGYSRFYVASGPPGYGDAAGDVGVLRYAYTAVPLVVGSTGRRGFGGDSKGRICQDPTGAVPLYVGGLLAPNCTPVPRQD